MLYPARGLAELIPPYTDGARTVPMEYPVLTWIFAFAMAGLTWLLAGQPDLAARRSVPLDQLQTALENESGLFLIVNGVFLVACVVIGAWVLWRWRPQGSDRAAWMWALSPGILLTGFINWDLLAALAIILALYAAHRHRWVWCGVAIGIGVAVKLYPLLLIGPIFVLALRNRQWRPFVLSSAAAAVTWAVCNVPAYLAGPKSWTLFWSFNAERRADTGSGWQVLRIIGHGLPIPVINLANMVLLVLACLAVLVLGLRVKRTPSLAALAFLVVWAFLALNKVYSPQYVLWLLPLAILALPRWRDVLIWQAGELVYFVGVMAYAGQLTIPASGVDKIYLSCIAIRYLAQLWFVGRIVQDLVRPDQDPGVVEAST